MRRAAVEYPGNTDIQRQLADTLATLKLHAQAADAFQPVAGKTRQPADLARLAALHDAAGDLDAAMATYDRIKLPPAGMADIHVLKAGALMARARREEAKAEIGKAIATNPANASLRLFIAKNFLDSYGAQPEADWITARLASPKAARLPREDLARLNFALGLAHEALGDHASAFTAIESGNRACAPANHNADAQTEQVAAGIARHFTKTRLAQLAPAGNPSPLPVFVTGMPRSGTTLVEQIIARHPHAGSTGEFELLPHLKQSVTSLQSADIRRAADAYLSAMTKLAPGKARVVDKSISTLLHAGLALLLFPNARLVFVRRHPMDVFWSAYREMFGAGSMTFSYSPQALVRRILVAEQLADEWQARCADRVMTVEYEQLAADPEVQARCLVAHTGLDWNDACLDQKQSPSVVRTASMAQVRKPIYTSSVGKWQAYASQLAPVAHALAPAIAAHEARQKAVSQ